MTTYFHGTRFSFENFCESTLGVNVSNPTTMLGLFFTDSFDGARRWSDYKGVATRTRSEKRIIEVNLNITNPYQITCQEFQYLLKSAQKKTIKQLREKAILKGFDGFSIEYVNQHSAIKEHWKVPLKIEQISIVAVHKICREVESLRRGLLNVPKRTQNQLNPRM